MIRCPAEAWNAIVNNVTSIKKRNKVLKLFSKNRAGLRSPAISRHIVQSITNAIRRLPKEASGNNLGSPFQLMRIIVSILGSLKHRCNTEVMGF